MVVQFKRDYATFGNQIRPFETDEDVGLVVTEFLFEKGLPFYPIGTLMGTKISTVWLGEGFPPDNVEEFDIIFKMRKISGANFFEIVIRSDPGPYWGGSIYGQEIELIEEYVAGHVVIMASADGAWDRYEYNPQHGRYFYADTVGGAKRTVRSVRKLRKASGRLVIG